MVRLKKILKSNSGFSLLELVVASGVSLIVAGIAVFAFMMTIDT
ncbi:MAG: prepilin-type N-terminal cleavage/methylation domain-containing protein [Bdellovibrionaceae bacterium]|nr:prepilin-type N-terminal cleavage/methylation domain-containing protein [Pseudobdellovibrionaceae bacterium]